MHDQTPAAGLRRGLLRNILSGWVVFGVAVVSGFALTPYILHKIGASHYGLWVLAASLSGYLGLFDFGWGPAVTTQIARTWESGDHQLARDYLGAAFWLHLGAGMVVIAVAVSLSLLTGRIFAFAPDEIEIARELIFVTGLTVGVGLPLSVFSTALSGGLFRHDLANAVELFAALGRVVLTVAIMETTRSIIMLAWGVLVIATLAHVARLLVLRRRWRDVRVPCPPRGHPAWAQFARFGGWGFLWIAAERILFYLGALIVGIRFSAGLTAVWGIAAKFGEYLRLLARSASDVHLSLVSRASGATGERPDDVVSRESRTFIAGIVFSAAIMLWFNGDLVLVWWVGEIARDAAGPMRWMLLIGPAAAVGLPAQADWIARGRLAAVAAVALSLTICAAIAASWVPSAWGLTGVAVAISVPTAAIWGGVLPFATRRDRKNVRCSCFPVAAQRILWPVLSSVILQGLIWFSREQVGERIGLILSLAVGFSVIAIWISRNIRRSSSAMSG